LTDAFSLPAPRRPQRRRHPDKKRHHLRFSQRIRDCSSDLREHLDSAIIEVRMLPPAEWFGPPYQSIRLFFSSRLVAMRLRDLGLNALILPQGA
jgi:hypothetical protein